MQKQSQAFRRQKLELILSGLTRQEREMLLELLGKALSRREAERVAVTLGVVTDTQVEILSRINEGDVVTVYSSPVQDTELMSNPMIGGGP